LLHDRAAHRRPARRRHADREKDRYRTLDEYRRAQGQNMHAVEGSCDSLPEKLDVGALHADTVGYAERVRGGGAPSAQPRGWLDWLFRR
jgi:hypothetical protein